MRTILISIPVAVALLICPAAAAPLAAQCMGCVSSSACGDSSSRGNCSAECIGTVCACSDTRCRPQVTVAPAGAEHSGQWARAAEGQPREEVLGFLVRDCDGTTELLVYSADGTRLIESRLLSHGREELATARPVNALRPVIQFDAT